VTLTLSTHDAGGLTDKDFAMAAKADGLSALAAPAVKPVTTKVRSAAKPPKKA
jgi:hypothetical protein